MLDLFPLTECENIVKSCLKTQVKIINSEVTSLPNENLSLKIKIHDGVAEKILSFFVKSTKDSTATFLKVIFDDFRRVVSGFDPKVTPKLYHKNANFLFFEDVTLQGFRTREENFDIEHIKVVLKALANLHFGSFAYEEIKSKEKYFRLNQKYKVDLLKIDPKRNDVCKLISSLKNVEKLKILEEIEEKQLCSKFRRVLCHGNLTVNNIMFQYHEKGPVECKLINFNTHHYMPPIYDVLQLIFFTTSEEFLKQHLEDLLSYYHECLKEEFQNYLNIDKILPFEQLRKEVHHFLPLIKLENALICQNDSSLEELEQSFACPILSREDCYSIIRNKIGRKNFILSSFKVTPLDEVNGYLGNYHKLKLEVSHDFDETIECFMKATPKNSSAQSIVHGSGCFFKELFIYDTLIPQMRNFGIDTINGCLPRCFFQRSEEIMVFEDMTLRNFRTLPSQISFDRTLLSLSIKKLARFHASTIVFEEKKSEETNRKYRISDEYQNPLREIFFTEENRPGGVLMQIGLKTIPDALNLFPELKTETNQANFSKMWPKLQKVFFTGVRPSDLYRNVVSHGDLWTNNIMVKFDGTKPIDCVFVDYQCIRYCPPAHDFLSVVFLTTDRCNRMKFEEEMQKVYFEEFSKILQCYGYNVDKILSYGEFIKTIEYIRPQMILQAIVYKMFIMCTSEEISSFLVDDQMTNHVFFEDRRNYLKEICQRSSVVRNAIRDCVLDLYSLCNQNTLN